MVETAQFFSSRTKKDPYPVTMASKDIVALAEAVHKAGKVLHIFGLGCNTVNLVVPVKSNISEAASKSVWFLCTNHVWPSDLATVLWSQYGGLLSVDLCEYRRATRELLDEYTEHYRRQRIIDPGMQSQSREMSSLADCVYLDRLDRVSATPHGDVAMQAL